MPVFLIMLFLYGLRRRRHYAKQNLYELLEQNNVDTAQLMPKLPPEGTNVMQNVKLNVDPNNPAPFPPFLPLHIFDDYEYDCRTPEEWVEMGKSEGIRKPVPGKALLPTRDDVHHCE